MLSVILACDDPYRTADLFVTHLGWRLVFATPADSDDRLACIELGDAPVMLGTAEEEFLPWLLRQRRRPLPKADHSRRLHATPHATNVGHPALQSEAPPAPAARRSYGR